MTIKKAVGRPKKGTSATPFTTEIGQPLVGMTQQALIQDSREKDLAMPKRFAVFDTMAQDDAVFTATYATSVSCYDSLTKYKVTGKGVVGKANAEFIDYNLKNLESGTFNNMINDALQILRYGFVPVNHVFKRRDYGPYKGTYCLSKLSMRDPRSVYAWLWDNDYRECIGFAQHRNDHQYSNSHQDYKSKERMIDFSYSKDIEYTILKSNQYLHFRHNGLGNNPQGDSPYMHCYSAWAEKKIVEKLELIGLTKDLGGAFIVRVPADLVQKANNPTDFPEAYQEYLNIQTDAAKLQNGESSMLVLLSDADPHTNKFLYDLEIKGVDGGLFKASLDQ